MWLFCWWCSAVGGDMQRSSMLVHKLGCKKYATENILKTLHSVCLWGLKNTHCVLWWLTSNVQNTSLFPRKLHRAPLRMLIPAYTEHVVWNWETAPELKSATHPHRPHRQPLCHSNLPPLPPFLKRRHKVGVHISDWTFFYNYWMKNVFILLPPLHWGPPLPLLHSPLHPPLPLPPPRLLVLRLHHTPPHLHLGESGWWLFISQMSKRLL